MLARQKEKKLKKIPFPSKLAKAQLMGPMLIGIGQSRTPHRLDPKMIKRTALGGQSGFNAAQTVLAGELAK